MTVAARPRGRVIGPGWMRALVPDARQGSGQGPGLGDKLRPGLRVGSRVPLGAALGVALTLALAACDRGTPPEPGAGVAGQGAAALEAVGAGGAGGAVGKGTRGPTQVAARINGQEVTIHQVQERLPAVMGGGGGTSAGSQSDTAPGQQALEQLIDLTLIGQEAAALGLEKDPAVMRQLQAARQEVLARAWAQQMVEDEPSVPAAEVRRYYDEHPSWFAQRRVFHLQELRCEGHGADPANPASHGPLLQNARDPEQALAALQRSGMRCRLMALNLGGEQLSPGALERLQGLRRGDSMAAPGGSGLRHWWLQAAVEQPITWAQAQPAIERALQAQRHAQRARREVQRLREAARIETFGEFSTPDRPRGESLVRP